MISGTTGTGLDRLLDIIAADEGLAARIPASEIDAGARAADRMNAIIVEGIAALGIASNGVLNTADIRDLSDWIATNRAGAFIAAHGDDEDGSETGFHLIQSDGGVDRLFGEAAIDTVADGIYHLVFGYEHGRLLNEDGDANVRLESVAWWLGDLMADDLGAAARGEGPLASDGADPYAKPSTGTGLDLVNDYITNDPGLNRNVSNSEANEAAQAAHVINRMILDAIRTLSLASDGDLTASDVRSISNYIRSDAGRLAAFVAAHGDDESDEETGFHLVQNDGSELQLFGQNAINTVFDGIYHIGFEIIDGRLRNEDGDANASAGTVAYWLDSLLREDISSGRLGGVEVGYASTGTGLDLLTGIILDDDGLEARVSEGHIRNGARAADTINAIIVDAIRATGVAANGTIKASDVRDINAHIRADSELFARFVAAHGDDEDGVETGFHLVQNDGATSRLFAQNAVDTVADGLYHIGFEIVDGRLRNEDGDANASLKTVAGWLNGLLSESDFAALARDGAPSPYVAGTTGTGLDRLVDIVSGDDGLAARISTSEIREGARAAQNMNALILDKIVATGIANDGIISKFDVVDLNAAIRADADALRRFVNLHGDDEDDAETGFHLVQNDGAVTQLFGRNAVNSIADSIYHIGFEIAKGRFVNEDGDANAHVSEVADWLEGLLAADLAAGRLRNPDLLPGNVDTEALLAGRVFHTEGPITVSKLGGAVEFPATDAWKLAAGTIAFGFAATSPAGEDRDTIFSRDASGYGDGGHITAWVKENDLVVRVQSTDSDCYLVAEDAIAAGRQYGAALTFDGSRALLYLDGQIVDAEATDMSWANATEALNIGASLMYRGEGETRTDDPFDGVVEYFALFDTALGQGEIIAHDRLERGIEVETPAPPPEDGGVAPVDLAGTGGDDRLIGGAGDDTLTGGDGSDTLNGGDGDDLILCGTTGADARDIVYAGRGDDSIDGGHGNDLIFGQDGDDTIAGGFGADDLQGQNGNDVITGSAFADILFGGAGDDFLNGGFGHDLINGGAGGDRFFHAAGSEAQMQGHGSDWVQDYSAAEGDVLVFGGPATADQFQVNLSHTENRTSGERAGDDTLKEAFVIYTPTGQVLWALVDGGGQASINLQIGAEVFDLLG